MSTDGTPAAGSAIDEPGPATVLITRIVQPGHEQEYTAWMGRLIAATEASPQSLGTVVLSPGSGEVNTFRLIQRFANSASLRAWEDSDVRARLSAEADEFSSAERQAATGLDSWFTINQAPAAASPPKWKSAVLTFIITYALTALIIPRETAWLPHSWSFYEEDLITVALLTLVMTYGMPYISRWLRRWLS